MSFMSGLNLFCLALRSFMSIKQMKEAVLFIASIFIQPLFMDIGSAAMPFTVQQNKQYCTCRFIPLVIYYAHLVYPSVLENASR